MTVAPDSAGELEAIRAEYGITFAIRPGDMSTIRPALVQDGLAVPALLVVRRGRVESRLTGSSIDRLAPQLVSLFAEN
jgi:hypothetical protein